MSRAEGRAWPTRTARDRSDSATRAALLDAAEQVFAEQGYQQTSVAGIAERAGTSRPTFYVYFPSREAVFRALAERVRDEIHEVQRAAGRGVGGPRLVVDTAIRAALPVYARNARFITVMQHQALTDPDVARLWREVQEAPSRVDADFIELLRREHGARPVAAAPVVADVVAASLVQLGRRVAERPDLLDPLADDLVAVYLRLVGWPAAGEAR